MIIRNLRGALPRRVIAYFLLFALAAIIWLGAGVYYVSRAVTQSRSTEYLLSAIGKASHQVALKHVESGADALQPAIVRLCREHSLAYAAVISPSGRYLAHSTPKLVATTAEEPHGGQAADNAEAAEAWGDVQRIRLTDNEGRVTWEYRAPLRAGERVIGSLRMGVVQPSVWTTILAIVRFGPVAVIGPLLFLGFGSFLLRRLVRPVADVEHQLRSLAVAPSLVEQQLEEVEVRGAASLGWNRLVDHQRTGGAQAELHDRLGQSLESIQHRKLSEILNSLGDGVVATDAEGKITYHNTAVIALLERRQRPRLTAGDGGQTGQAGTQARSAATPSGRPNKDSDEGTPLLAVSLEGESMVPWIERSWLVPPASPLIGPGSRQRKVAVELERSGEGERRVLRVTRTPLRAGESSELDGHVWVLRDITQQKLAEEMRAQFVDTATHELRTPLANIKAYAETLALQDMHDVEQQKDFLNTINSEATRLARFVDDLLSVSSMEVGSLSLTKQPTDLSKLFNSVISKVQPQMKEKQITFETQFPEKWPEPQLDKDKIAATIVNLLGNASKYTPHGGRVGLRVKVNEGQLEISVEDTGYGIAKEEIPKLFDKFFRSSDPRVTEETGSGLGLSLAQEVVRLHGGRIAVDSELNKGSTFLVTLPMG